MSDLLQGLTISVIGLLITFLSLGLFILIMIVIQRIFPPKSEEIEMNQPPDTEITTPSISIQTGTDPAIIAAIAAAIRYFQSPRMTSLGDNLLAGRGNWWNSHQTNNRRLSSSKK